VGDSTHVLCVVGKPEREHYGIKLPQVKRTTFSYKLCPNVPRPKREKSDSNVHESQHKDSLIHIDLRLRV